MLSCQAVKITRSSQNGQIYQILDYKVIIQTIKPILALSQQWLLHIRKVINYFTL